MDIWKGHSISLNLLNFSQPPSCLGWYGSCHLQHDRVVLVRTKGWQQWNEFYWLFFWRNEHYHGRSLSTGDSMHLSGHLNDPYNENIPHVKIMYKDIEIITGLRTKDWTPPVTSRLCVVQRHFKALSVLIKAEDWNLSPRARCYTACWVRVCASQWDSA